MTWREGVVKVLCDGFGEMGQLTDMVLVYDGETTQLLNLAMPTLDMQKAALMAARQVIMDNRRRIKEVALIANVSAGGVAPSEAVMVLFESKTDTAVQLFRVAEKKLEGMPAAQIAPWLGLGLFERKPDLGGMYR